MANLITYDGLDFKAAYKDGDLIVRATARAHYGARAISVEIPIDHSEDDALKASFKALSDKYADAAEEGGMMADELRQSSFGNQHPGKIISRLAEDTVQTLHG